MGFAMVNATTPIVTSTSEIAKRLLNGPAISTTMVVKMAVIVVVAHTIRIVLRMKLAHVLSIGALLKSSRLAPTMHNAKAFQIHFALPDAKVNGWATVGATRPVIIPIVVTITATAIKV